MVENPLTIEKAKEKHIPRIASLAKQEMGTVLKKAWRSDFDWKDWEDDVRDAIKGFILEKVHVYSLKDKPDRIIAFTWITFESQLLWIDSIVIDRLYQRQGYGSFILAWLIEKYAKPNKLPSIQLGVQDNNKEAIEFYKKHGFVEMSYIDLASTHIMEKSLSSPSQD